ncbi:MAG TPA: ATP-grasp domain-containing protein [Mycobacteriales bacterium]|nr:ATP-grasp domain-containing protein [Gaiellales bacterium]HVB26742.1 ATP-grasp domain-containing protein [Mycobacteriales bacterium]
MSRAALIIEDGTNSALLPAARALARAGWTVDVAGPARNPRLRGSRAVRGWHRLPPPEGDLDAFLTATADLVRTKGYQVVFPGDDIEVLALSAGRDRLPAVVPYAAHDTVLQAVDKLEFTRAAQAAGLAVPRTDEATPATLASVPLPVVVKARLHWTLGVDAPDRHLSVEICSDRAAARARAAAIRSAGGTPILQERLDGEQGALTLVLDRAGTAVATVQQRLLRASLRQTSVRAETVPPEPELVDGCVRMLRDLGWFGLANIQFLRDPDGACRFIDLNARFYGSIALAIAAGANLPALWAGLAVGETPTPVVGRPGVRFHGFENDVFLAVTSAHPARAVAGAVGYAMGAAHSTWRVDDPVPALLRAGTLSGRALRRLLRRAPPAAGV